MDPSLDAGYQHFDIADPLLAERAEPQTCFVFWLFPETTCQFLKFQNCLTSTVIEPKNNLKKLIKRKVENVYY